MKRTILVFVILFVIAGQSVCYSQGQPNVRTSGFINGHTWLLMDKLQKHIFLEGVRDGYDWHTLVLSIQKDNSQKDFDEMYKSNSTKGTIDEDARQIDLFYKDSSNLTIPIIAARQWVILKIKGATPKELKTFTEEIMKEVSKFDKK